MDKLTQELTFFLGYAVATFLTKTNRWTESIGFYSECLALWNKMSKRKPSPVMNLIERVIGEKVALGELFLFERGMKCYDLGEIKESINCFKKALPLYRQIGSKEREAWCRCRLGRSFHLAGQYETAMEHYKKVLSSIREISLHAMRQELQARVYNDIGEINHIRGRYEEAQMCYEKALKISIRLGKEEYQATSLNNLGVLNHNCLGKLHEALSFQEKALEIRRRLGCGREEGFSCNNIGGVYEALGDYEKALEYYRKSYKLSLEIKDKVLEGKNLYFIGKVHNILGQLQKAIEYHERALKIKLQTGVRTSGVLTDLGNHYLSLGDYEKASQYHKKAIKACEEIGDLEHLEICLNNACQVPFSLGEHEKAKSYLEKAIGVHESTGNKVNIVTTFCNISGVCRSAGQYQEAREYLEKALKISRETEHIQGKTAALYFMGSLNFSLGKYEQAIEYTEKALKIAKEISEKQREESCYALLGSVYFVRGQNERAIWYQNKALEMMKEIGKKDQSHINVLHNLGQTYSSQGNLSKACKTLLEGIEIHKSIRSSLKDETNKILLNDKNFPCYKSLSLLLLCERNFNQALLTLELGRSRALVDLMSKNYGINRNPAQNELTLNTLQSFLKEQKKNFLFIETFQTGCFALWFVDTGGSVKFKRVCVNASEEPGMDTSSLTLDDLQCEDRSLASLYGYDPFASL
ncbi:tetratricopeptide repeat protein 28-like [Stylophora pistillata]|uniref:Tetratricopeptide repeat protein 28 n=1 Tax=Stylophora pistillata TaxID=50429 RepID=A0A2B4SMP6_STYPI|nr:tetratricopeptide repeat protein 28-like [Stylophora pistillata]PFX30379.1 Tetratricopeptide repeat protein 28 [Stylophora pistillata]